MSEGGVETSVHYIFLMFLKKLHVVKTGVILNENSEINWTGLKSIKYFNKKKPYHG
jgi:hypothetical protein